MRSNYTIYGILLLQTLVLALLAGVVLFPSQDRLKQLHYESEAATLVSPHSLREELERLEQNYVIIDTRDAESYRAGHITTAINIEPGEGMVEAFRRVRAENPDKELLIYCYTEVCMRGRKVGRELARNGVYVKEIGVGFNEWKHYWKKWNYENEWDHVYIERFITTGEEPGELQLGDVSDLFKSSSCGTVPGYSC